jgi:hypothetical protein
MFRTVLALGLTGLAVSMSGCRICCHPYDWCGPVYEGSGCQPCGSSCSLHARAGSILAGGGSEGVPPSAAMARRPQSQAQARLKTTAPASQKPGLVPGSERIVSVTDHVVPSAAKSTSPAIMAADSPRTDGPSLSSTGWTARRPDAETLR